MTKDFLDENRYDVLKSFGLSNIEDDYYVQHQFPYILSSLDLADEDFWMDPDDLADDELYSYFDFHIIKPLGLVVDSLDVYLDGDDEEFFFVDETEIFF